MLGKTEPYPELLGGAQPRWAAAEPKHREQKQSRERARPPPLALVSTPGSEAAGLFN